MIDRDLAIDKALGEAKTARAAIFVGNGNNARVAYSIDDSPRIFYMLGSMGHCAPIAAGFSASEDIPTVSIEGDGNALMGMSALPLVAECASRKFAHIVLDNGLYETTGGQRTLSRNVDFVGLALASGYSQAVAVVSIKGLVDNLRAAFADGGPMLLHVRTHRAGDRSYSRVPLKPSLVSSRFRNNWHAESQWS